MSKYLIRINCPCFKDVEVEANDEVEAIRKAKIEFYCDGGEAEYGETIKANYKCNNTE